MAENDWVWLKLARLRLAEARLGALGAAQRLTAYGQTAACETRSGVFNAHGKRVLFPFAASPPVQVRTSLSKFRPLKRATIGSTVPAPGYSGAEAQVGSGSWTTIACE